MDGKAVTPLLARQDGVVCRRQLLAIGWGPDAIDYAVRSERLHRIHAGDYSVAPLLAQRARWRAAVLATQGVLSHVSAAAVHGLLADRRIDVEVITTRHARSQRGLIVRRSALEPSDVMRCDDLPVTTPTRTILDLVQTVPQHLVVEAAMEAIHRGVLDEARVLTVEWRGRRGGASLVALRRRLVDRTRSELEAAMLRLCGEAGLPEPQRQHRVGRATLDFAWPDQRFAVETDGWMAHRGPRRFQDDRARDAWLATRGWTVLRFTDRQLAERAPLVVAAIRARLAGA